jgi:hypothetical protein
MCANCGCGIPEDKHGDDRNISWSEVEVAAEANDMSPTKAVENMQEMAGSKARRLPRGHSPIRRSQAPVTRLVGAEGSRS